jgi:hypothetical protein
MLCYANKWLWLCVRTNRILALGIYIGTEGIKSGRALLFFDCYLGPFNFEIILG